MSSSKRESRHGRQTQAQQDHQLLQRLQKTIIPQTIYLSDDFKSTYLIAAENTQTAHLQPLPVLTVLRAGTTSTTITHVLLPRTLHPHLSRTYAPTRTLERQATLPQKTFWVGFDLKFAHRYQMESDFITALDQAMEIKGMAFIVDEPGQAPVRAFMMEIRGLFRDEADVMASAQRQVHILDWLVLGAYVVLGGEILGGRGRK